MTTKVTFQLPSEIVDNASDGILLGEFNNWNPEEGVQLQKNEDGSMYAELDLAAGQSYQYRYLLNDGRWVNDYSSTTAIDVYGNLVENCVVNVIAPEQVQEAIKVAAKTIAPKKAAAPKKEAKPKAETSPKKTAAPKKEPVIKKSANLKSATSPKLD